MPKKITKRNNTNSVRGAKLKIWASFVVLFVCGMMTSISDKPHAACASATVKQEITTDEMTACEIIEKALLRNIITDIDNYMYEHPQYNIEIYTSLVENGCPENTEKYSALLEREQKVVSVLYPSNALTTQETCEKIEVSLLDRMPYGGKNANSDDRIERAQIYANLSERGCAENVQKYKELAKQELEIARALTDDKFDQHETIEVVETYKRLNMQAAANEIFETAKKLTNPAIDFILEVEKIINEQ